jgi:hypothetical protein
MKKLLEEFHDVFQDNGSSENNDKEVFRCYLIEIPK